MYLQYLVFSLLETIYDSESIALICHCNRQCHCATQSPAPALVSVSHSLLLLQAIPRSFHP